MRDRRRYTAVSLSLAARAISPTASQNQYRRINTYKLVASSLPRKSLSACAASEAWSLLGETGLVAKDALPDVGDSFPEGKVGYHLRSGSHFFSRTDWLRHMDYRDRHHV